MFRIKSLSCTTNLSGTIDHCNCRVENALKNVNSLIFSLLSYLTTVADYS